jgi:hypothetical protein
MKLSQILPLVVGSAAAGVFASTSPAHALDFNFSWTDSTNGYGVSGTVYGLVDNSTSAATQVFGQSNVPGDTGWMFTNPYSGFNSFTVTNGTITSYLWLSDQNNQRMQLVSPNSGNGGYHGYYTFGGTEVTTYFSSEPNFGQTAAVPFDIPGGATIPSVGALLALGAMRKARKSIASKTRLANPVCASVS